MFAKCMGHYFVIKALFYAQCVDTFVPCQGSLLSRSAWSRVQLRRVRVHCFCVNKDVRVCGGACGRWTNRKEVCARAERRRWSMADVTVWTGAEWSASLSAGKRSPPSPSVCGTNLWNASMGGSISRKSQVRDPAFRVQPCREKSADKLRAWGPIWKHWSTWFHLTWTVKVSGY